MLDAGGTAADACVAMAAAMAVLSPMMTGPGGDAFLLHREAATGRVRALEGAGRAGRGRDDRGDARPRARRHARARRRAGDRARRRARCGRTRPPSSGGSGSPSCSRPRARSPRRASRSARVSARMWREEEATLRRDEAAAAAFLPGGRAPREGELRPPARTSRARSAALAEERRATPSTRARSPSASSPRCARPAGSSSARTWPRTARRGSSRSPPDYRGLARARAAAADDRHRRADDPARRSSARTSPRSTRCAPSASTSRSRPTQHAFAALHAHVGDPEFVDVPVAAMLLARAAPRRRPGRRAGRGAGDTVYLCAVDRDGNGCSFINSLYKAFGSGIVAPGTGVCLHDRGFGFSLEPGHPERARPGQAAAAHDHPRAGHRRRRRCGRCYGNMGGYMQPQGHAQVLVNLRDHGMTPQEAVDHPRHFLDGGVLLVEGRVPGARGRASCAAGATTCEVGPPYASPTGGAQVDPPARRTASAPRAATRARTAARWRSSG